MFSLSLSLSLSLFAQVRTMLEKERAEWDEERLKANVGLDQLASQHQQNLSTQNNQLEELKLQAELKVRASRSHLRTPS
jgi:hypothetical protein